MSFGSGFLRHPDLFPGRRSGEAWGERALALQIPGGPYLLSGLAAAQEEALRQRFGPLCGPAAREEEGIAVAVFRAPAADFLEIDTRGWEYALDLDPAPHSLRVAGLRLMARLDWSPKLAAGLWTPEAAGEEWTGICENLLRLLAAYRLLAAGGVLLHSAGLSDGESAWLLLGPSGAGKTTASRLCLAAGADVLSDDLNAVLPPPVDGDRPVRPVRPVVMRLPFTGDLGERQGGPGNPGGYPLRAVLRLRQGPAESLAPLSPASALAALLAAAPYVNRDPWRREPLLAALERLARTVPAWELTFSPGADLWSILQSTI
ncbi:MAG: hypothetical protein QOF89_3875 [Acidobacteriota bacterium]|jgi:hypothetical protein|nr:hypothetical protein [Acidobacteriota bacterium]